MMFRRDDSEEARCLECVENIPALIELSKAQSPGRTFRVAYECGACGTELEIEWAVLVVEDD